MDRSRSMRLESFPIAVGVVASLLGLALFADALAADRNAVARERRRRPRPVRHRGGELALGAGVVAMAAALMGRESWRFDKVAALLAFLLLGLGMSLNQRYIRGLAFGPILGTTLRRRVTDQAPREVIPARLAAPEALPISLAALPHPAQRLRIR